MNKGGGSSGGGRDFQEINLQSPTGTAGFTRNNLTMQDSDFGAGARSFFESQFGTATQDVSGLGAFGTSIVDQGVQNFANDFGNAQQADFGASNAQTTGFINQSNQAADQFAGLGNRGMDALFGAPDNTAGIGMANAAAGRLLGSADSAQAMGNQMTAQLNNLARPAEEQAVNKKFNSLFGTGRLGNTGGQGELGQLALAQSQAQDARNLAGMQFGADQFAQNQALANQFLGTGGSLTNADQSMAATVGGIGAGMFGLGQNTAQAGTNASIGMDERNVQLQDDRLARTEALFGFGQHTLETPSAQASRALQAQNPLNVEAFNSGNLAIQAANVSSGVNPVENNSNPLAGAVGGLGAGLFDRGLRNHEFRGRNPNGTPTQPNADLSFGSAASFDPSQP
jgi:hypothetical protein